MNSEAEPVQRRDITNLATPWLRTRLSRGKLLSRTVLHRIDLDNGTAVTFVEPNVADASLVRWEVGGIASCRSSTDQLVKTIHESIQGQQLYFVAENADARASDPHLRRAGGKRFCVGDDVYEFVSPGASEDDIRQCIYRADAGYTLNGFVISLGRTPSSVETVELFQNIPAGPEIIVVRAYDGESFVVWQGLTPAAGN